MATSRNIMTIIYIMFALELFDFRIDVCMGISYLMLDGVNTGASSLASTSSRRMGA